MKQLRLLALVSVTWLGACGDDPEGDCPAGFLPQGDRCVTAFDVGTDDSGASPDAGADVPVIDGGPTPDGGADACASEELCNGEDDDCDGAVDEGLAASTFYADMDEDGAGDLAAPCPACDVSVCENARPEVRAWAERGNDCDDSCALCFPGAPEACDSMDNDCDALTDEGASNTFYADTDDDTYGDEARSCAACDAVACPALATGAWVAQDGDCNDECDTCFPGGTEVCDELDNDCSGVPDSGLQNTFYRDADGDGHGDPETTGMFCGTEAPDGWATSSDDCADHDERAFSGNTEFYGAPIVAPVPPGGAYDFDCDGAEELDFAECGPQRCGPSRIDPRSPNCYVSGTRGCGNARMAWSCGCPGISCSSSIDTVRQGCR